MITLFQIDKSGRDIFDKDYSVVLVVDKKEIYGINIPQEVKDVVRYNFRKGELRIGGISEDKKKTRLRLRLHTSIIIKLLEKAIKDLGYVEDVNIQICNDFDGHFHEIRDMVYKNLNGLIPSLEIEDIVSTRFQKPSLIDNAGKAFRTKDKNLTKEYTPINLNSEELVKLIKK